MNPRCPIWKRICWQVLQSNGLLSDLLGCRSNIQKWRSIKIQHPTLLEDRPRSQTIKFFVQKSLERNHRYCCPGFRYNLALLYHPVRFIRSSSTVPKYITPYMRRSFGYEHHDGGQRVSKSLIEFQKEMTSCLSESKDLFKENRYCFRHGGYDDSKRRLKQTDRTTKRVSFSVLEVHEYASGQPVYCAKHETTRAGELSIIPSTLSATSFSLAFQLDLLILALLFFSRQPRGQAS